METLAFAGETLPATLVHRAREALSDVRIVNAYGQTESFYATTFTADGTGTGSTPSAARCPTCAPTSSAPG
ncbi:hypothetical protein [Streptomyces sp. XD-27]|uniref:hypothetical protein n=1 Tax=Streptomyces sp. XD-27 TaxID=3062779 RepID=UPI00350E42E0